MTRKTRVMPLCFLTTTLLVGCSTNMVEQEPSGDSGSGDSGEGDSDVGSNLTYPVIETNQADCYDESGGEITCGSSLDGQDAQYNSHAQDFVNNGDGTVTDNVSGMIWQRHHSEAITYAEAAPYCESLDLGGQTDWRVPNMKELFSLIDFTGYTGNPQDSPGSWTPSEWKLYIDGSYDPTNDSAVFIQEYGNNETGGRIIDCQIWSSSDPVDTTMNNDDSALGGNFCDGRIKSYPKHAAKFAKCVRGNVGYTENSFEITDDGKTVTDHATGLVWTKAYSNDTTEFPQVAGIGEFNGSMNWAAAMAFCEDLDYAGATNWRLPDVKQLQSIVAYGQGAPAIDTSFFDLDSVEFPDYCNGGSFTDYPYFWSSTSHVEYSPPASSHNAARASYVVFGRGIGTMTSGANWIDAHGPGSQRSDLKNADPSASQWACGFGPQGDYIGINNYVRCTR